MALLTAFILLFFSIHAQDDILIDINNLKSSKRFETLKYLKKEKRCEGLKITNSRAFSSLQNCTLVEGHVAIHFNEIDRIEPLYYLKEITGYLAIYGENSLVKSFDDILPNLVIIRGKTLLYGQSLVVVHSSISYLGLKSLKTIVRGKIFISNNPNLCNLDRIDWSSIAPTKPYISNINFYCTKTCNQRCQYYYSRITKKDPFKYKCNCWTPELCQPICSPKCTERNLTCSLLNPNICCNADCFGGCYSETEEESKTSEFCVSCKDFVENGVCKDVCPDKTYSTLHGACYSARECLSNGMVIMKGKCLAHCDYEYAVDSNGFCQSALENPNIYQNCDDEEIHLNSIEKLRRLRNCRTIKTLSISLFQQDISQETLDKAFFFLREIKESLLVFISQTIISLNFLRRLEKIGTSHLTDRLSILSNKKLMKIFDKDTLPSDFKISIKVNATVWIQDNPTLCYEEITSVFSENIELVGRNLTKTEISNFHENGKYYTCDSNRFPIKIDRVTLNSVKISWSMDSVVKLIDHEMAMNSTLTIKPSDVGVSIGLIYLEIEEPSTFKSLFLFSQSEEKKYVICERHDPALPENENLSNRCETQVGNLQPNTKYIGIVIIKFIRFYLPLPITSIMFEFKTESINPDPVEVLTVSTLNETDAVLYWFHGLLKAEHLNDPEKLSRYKNTGDQPVFLIWIREIASRNEIESPFACSVRIESKGAIINDLFPFSEEKNTKHNMADYWSGHSHCSSVTLTGLLNYDADGKYKKCKRSIKKWPSESSIWLTERNGSTVKIRVVEHNSETILSLSREKTVDDISLFVMPFTAVKFNTEEITAYVYPFQDELMYFEQNLNGLKPFTNYIVEIQICNRPSEMQHFPWSSEVPDTAFWKSYEEKYCSIRMPNSFRTQPDVEADRISHVSIRTCVHNERIILFWLDPPKPNGRIQKYLFRYRPLDSEKAWITTCVSKHDVLTSRKHLLSSIQDVNENLTICVNGILNEPLNYSLIKLDGLPTGNYTFQMLSVSGAPNSSIWSLPINISVPYYEVDVEVFYFNNTISRKNLIIAIVIMLSLLIVAGILGIRFYFRYKKLLADNYVRTNNPEYWYFYDVDNWEIGEQDLDFLGWSTILGKGSFGMVFQGILSEVNTPAKEYFKDAKNINVAIKTLNQTATVFDRRDFINEACYMKQFQSAHLVRLIGVITERRPKGSSDSRKTKEIKEVMSFKRVFGGGEEDESDAINLKSIMDDAEDDQNELRNRLLDLKLRKKTKMNHPQISGPLVVMELMAEGDLSNYLKHVGNYGDGIVPPSQAYLWATQIADGMAYLSINKFVHRDLAARNCLVNSKKIVKIGDFGLCRDIYKNNFYKKEGKFKVPIRWMAPESIQSAYFTSQSDVWSYGVVLWEIVTLASLPFQNMSHEEIVKYILRGNNLLSNGYPPNCPPLISAIMTHCFAFYPSQRPSFLGLLSLLAPRFGDKDFCEESFFYSEQGNERIEDLIGNLPDVIPGSEAEAKSITSLNVYESNKTTDECADDDDNSTDDLQTPSIAKILTDALNKLKNRPEISKDDDHSMDSSSRLSIESLSNQIIPDPLEENEILNEVIKKLRIGVDKNLSEGIYDVDDDDQ